MHTGPINREFWAGRRVLLTGHTGFKGSWLSFWLRTMGANVTGFSLPPVTEPSLHRLLNRETDIPHEIGDVRDASAVDAVVVHADPEIVIHMAAQALVRHGYEYPVDTFSTNALGTVTLLESLRQSASLAAVVVITSDKVYLNDDSGQRFGEDDKLGSVDPYSASKACQDIISNCYAESFLRLLGVRLGIARAGNVIGGGDWAKDRLLTDIEVSIAMEKDTILRNPKATRPWQHVLEPLAGYLLYAEALVMRPDVPRALNFGPGSSATVETATDLYLENRDTDIGWVLDQGVNPQEAHALEIDAALARKVINWTPRLSLNKTIEWTAEWYNLLSEGHSASDICRDQIAAYEHLAGSDLIK